MNVVRNIFISVFVLQESCANVWPTTGQETIDNFDVNCKEVQPFDGYDVIKLEVTNLTRVGIHPHLVRI